MEPSQKEATDREVSKAKYTSGILIQMYHRAFFWPSVIIMAALTAAIYLMYLPENDPKQALKLSGMAGDFLEDITSPLKYAKFAMQEPDTELLMPVYGARMNAVNDTWATPRSGGRSHEGQDIFAKTGTPIFSATDGYVRRIRTTEIGGKNILITGAGGRRYYYAHLDSFAKGLTVGDWVTTDTVIGFVGNTGNAINTPPHLHFGMYEKYSAINPYDLLTDRW